MSNQAEVGGFSRQALTVLDSMEIALFASAGLLNSTIPQPLDVPSSCCRMAFVYVNWQPCCTGTLVDTFEERLQSA